MVDVARELELLTALGPRLSGSPQHTALVDHVAGSLAALGLDVHRDTHDLDRRGATATLTLDALREPARMDTVWAVVPAVRRPRRGRAGGGS